MPQPAALFLRRSSPLWFPDSLQPPRRTKLLRTGGAQTVPAGTSRRYYNAVALAIRRSLLRLRSANDGVIFDRQHPCLPGRRATLSLRPRKTPGCLPGDLLDLLPGTLPDQPGGCWAGSKFDADHPPEVGPLSVPISSHAREFFGDSPDSLGSRSSRFHPTAAFRPRTSANVRSSCTVTYGRKSSLSRMALPWVTAPWPFLTSPEERSGGFAPRPPGCCALWPTAAPICTGRACGGCGRAGKRPEPRS